MVNEALLASIETGKHLAGYQEEIRAELAKRNTCIVVLDDDPTGTQTVNNVPVITQWTEEVIEAELLKSPLFFILTNSRSLQEEEADSLGLLLGERLKKLSEKHHKRLIVISRGDSTLRGHYPGEVNALAQGLDCTEDKHVLIPAFLEGGRYTFKDIHYVQEGDSFIPAAETAFAKDNTFRYSNSDLRKWIEEKSSGVVHLTSITSISVAALRKEPIEAISAILEQPQFSHIVANATSYHDLQAIALASLRQKKTPVFRTAASFVNAISGVPLAPLLTREEILRGETPNGGLTIIGSYVPKTTEQLQYLKDKHLALFLELDVSKALHKKTFQEEIENLVKTIDTIIASGKDVVLYTSRKVLKGATKSESLEIVNKVSNGLVEIVKQLTQQPKYLLAKGGITSSDVATRGLDVERAMVLGQIMKGVPIWQLGSESKFPNMPYIVFPGNVGDKTALYSSIHQLQ